MPYRPAGQEMGTFDQYLQVIDSYGIRHTLLAELDLFAQVQVEHDHLVTLQPMLVNSGARLLIDHCGRPAPGAGLDQPGFQALLDAFTLEACFWASDWPFLKAPQRIDMGPLIRQVERLLAGSP
jgi:predicted TIM-barrel fold metal-dependent hydrolase